MNALSTLIAGEEAEGTVMELINRINRLRSLSDDELGLVEAITKRQARRGSEKSRVYHRWTHKDDAMLRRAARERGGIKRFSQMTGIREACARARWRHLKIAQKTNDVDAGKE